MIFNYMPPKPLERRLEENAGEKSSSNRKEPSGCRQNPAFTCFDNRVIAYFFVRPVFSRGSQGSRKRAGFFL
jgi:hypothetical protein